MRTMSITRTAKDLKTRGLQSRMDTGRNIEQKDELMVQEVISISNHGFCVRREKYTKEIRGELDPRDKEYIFPFQTTFNIREYWLQKGTNSSQNPPDQQINQLDLVRKKCEEQLKLQRTVFNYISEVCQNVSSISFRLLSKGELSDGEAKAFAVKAILSNIQSVLTDINSKLQQYAEKDGKPQLSRQFDDLMERMTKAVDEQLSQIFSQLAGHYPQAPPAGATANMREVITDVNRSQDEQNNLIFSSGIKISKYAKFSPQSNTFINKREDYTGFVMEAINQAIQITRTIVDKDQNLCQKFQQFTEGLFTLANTDKKTQKLSSEDKSRLSKLTSFQRTNIFHNLLSDTKVKQQPQAQLENQIQRQIQSSLQFAQRIVEQYKRNHKVLVAQKIPSHVNPFSHADIKENHFKVNHSSVLRIMTKWVESLQDIFEKPEQQIGERLYKFKNIENKIIDQQIDHQGCQVQMKKILIMNLESQYENVKLQLNKLKEENSLFQSYILSEMGSEYSCLKRFSKVRESSAQINAIAIQYTKKYLCILIDHLIKAGQCKLEDSSKPLLVNLVVFRVGDLLRSKLQCSQRSFINIMETLNQLDNSKQMEGKFRLVRVKNKLNMRDNNVLINYMFMGKVQCELQLSVQKMDIKDKHYYEFCHFLYQLTRGKLGVITECAIVVCQHDSIINSSTEAYYHPKCYEVFEKRKKAHKVHEKDKDIFKCVSCGQLKMGENTQLFQKESQCNICLVKRQGAQQKLKHKNDFLENKKRIRRYGQIKNGDYIISVNNQKAGKVFKLYKAWKPQQQLKLLLVEINEQVLMEFKKQDFQYSIINYFNIINKKKNKQELKELTYNLGNQITAQILELAKIKSQLLQEIQPFFEAYRNYRMQKNLIKLIHFKTSLINADDNNFKWNILKKIISAYYQGNINQLTYRKYKTLDWSHINSLSLQRDEIITVKQFLELVPNCTKFELEQNKLTQINFQRQTKLQYLSIWDNQISNIDFKDNPLLTTLYMGQNILRTINLKTNKKLTKLKLGNNKLKEVDLSSNSNLEILDIDDNQLEQIDLNSNTKLKQLFLSHNKLKKINLSPNTDLETICIRQNLLEQIDLGSLASLKYLDLRQNRIRKIDLSSNNNLSEVYLKSNQLQQIDLSSNIKLETLQLDNNKLKKINLSSNICLSILNLTSNLIQQIILSPNMHNLLYLYLGNNKLKEIDPSIHQNLTTLYIGKNQLKDINLQSNAKLNKMWLQDNKLQSVKFWISQVTDTQSLLSHQQSKQCNVTLLYWKEDSQKYGKMVQILKEKYKLGSQYNKYNCQYNFLGEERQ